MKQKQEASQHAERIAKMVVAARLEVQKKQLLDHEGWSEEDLEEAFALFRKTETVSIMGAVATSTFNSEAICVKRLVLETMAAPLGEAARVREATAPRRRNYAAPNTSRGLAGDKALEAQDADQRRRDAEAANSAAAAAERKKKADEKFAIDCEEKIPGIVDALSGEGAKEPGDLAEGPVRNLAPGVRRTRRSGRGPDVPRTGPGRGRTSPRRAPDAAGRRRTQVEVPPDGRRTGAGRAPDAAGRKLKFPGRRRTPPDAAGRAPDAAGRRLRT